MTEDEGLVIKEYWRRASHRIKVAETLLLNGDNDEAASLAFYAAFFAVSALLASSGMAFKKHRAVRSALHQRFIATGEIHSDVGDYYDFLQGIRSVGDYGQFEHVDPSNAAKAIERSHSVITFVSAYLDAKGIQYK